MKRPRARKLIVCKQYNDNNNNINAHRHNMNFESLCWRSDYIPIFHMVSFREKHDFLRQFTIIWFYGQLSVLSARYGNCIKQTPIWIHSLAHEVWISRPVNNGMSHQPALALNACPYFPTPRPNTRCDHTLLADRKEISTPTCWSPARYW